MGWKRPEPAVKLPFQEPDEVGASEPGRPHQAFVESRLRQYLRDNDVRSLVKPTRAEIREAAMPILCMARNIPEITGRFPLKRISRHRGAAAMRLNHAMENLMPLDWVKAPYSNTYRSPSYVDALIQLADDAGWLAKEIPLPAHAEPHHPAIFYTVEKKYGFPCGIPKEDSLIHADYVHTLNGQRISRQRVIHPWPILREGFFPERGRMLELGWDACYTLSVGKGGKAELQFHRAPPFAGVLGEPPLKIISMGNRSFRPPTAIVIKRSPGRPALARVHAFMYSATGVT